MPAGGPGPAGSPRPGCGRSSPRLRFGRRPDPGPGQAQVGAESPTLSAPKHHPRDRAADHIGGYAWLRVEGWLRIVKPREGARLRADGTSPRLACGPGRPRAARLGLPPAPPAEDLDAVHRPIRGMQD